MFSRGFSKKFNINYKYLLIPFVTTLPIIYGRNSEYINKAYCGAEEEDKTNTGRILNSKLLKIEQKLDYLLEKENVKVDVKDYPRFNKKYANMSILQKILTENAWRRNHLLITEEGYNINDIIQAGVDNQDHPLGLVSPSKDAYYTFEDILVTAAGLFHNRNVRMTKFEKENYALVKSMLNSLEEFLNTVAHSVEIYSLRNIEGYAFTSKISRSNRREIARNVLNTLKVQEGEIFNEETGKFLSLEKAFNMSEQNQFFNSCGFYRDMPDGRFVYVNNQQTLSLTINEEDHIKIMQSHKEGPAFTKYLLNYFDLLDKLSANLNFCYDENLGYLTSFPNNLGSGSYFKFAVKVPIEKIEEFKNHFKNISELQIKLIEGEENSNGNMNDLSIFEISNLTSFYNFSQALIELVAIKDLFKKEE